MSSPTEPAADGRTARRDRNREAALAAVHELVVEGMVLPSIEDVAARSGVSLRSLYRYFNDARQMQLEALAQRTAAAEPLYRLENVGQGSFLERVEAAVDLRIRLYEHSAPTIRAAYALAPSMPVIAAQVAARKQQLTQQAREHFAAELDALPRPRAEALLTCAELLLGFEAVEALRAERGLPVDAARDVLVAGLHALLEPR